MRGSGQSLIDRNSGIFLDRTADRAAVENVVLVDNLIGVYLDGTHDALVRHSIIHGLHTLRRPERGPSISIWNAPGSHVLDNELEGGRDGVFAVSSKQNTIRGNRLHGLRFAVHFMYTNETEVADNVSVGNDVGYVMMYSDRLRLHDNVSDGDRDNGLLFNYANASTITGNVVRHSEKCVFIYNANKNRFTDNWFEWCERRGSLHRRVRTQHDQRQQLCLQSDAGDVCRHPFARLGERGARQLLERQSGVRPER